MERNHRISLAAILLAAILLFVWCDTAHAEELPKQLPPDSPLAALMGKELMVNGSLFLMPRIEVGLSYREMLWGCGAGFDYNKEGMGAVLWGGIGVHLAGLAGFYGRGEMIIRQGVDVGVSGEALYNIGSLVGKEFSWPSYWTFRFGWMNRAGWYGGTGITFGHVWKNTSDKTDSEIKIGRAR